MNVQIAHPSATPQQIEAHLRAMFPRYSVTMRGGVPIVGDGAATGVMVKLAGPGQVKLAWAFPSMGAQMAVTLSIVLTGLLPGLILFGIVWLVVQGGVGRMKQEIASVLTGGAPPPQVAAGAPGSAGAAPGSFPMIAAIVCFVLAVMSLVPMFMFTGPGLGLFDTVFWIVLGVGALMFGAEQKRAFDTGTPRTGPALMIVSVVSILHGLHTLSFAFSAEGLWIVRALISALFWLATGGALIALQTKKTPTPASMIASGLTVGGIVIALLGLFTIYDLYELIDRGVDFGLPTIMTALRGVLWGVLGGAVIARAGAVRRAGNAVAPVPAAAQPAYPQQAYPQQQQYPQQPPWPGNEPKQ